MKRLIASLLLLLIHSPVYSAPVAPTFTQATTAVDVWMPVYFHFWVGIPDVNNDGCLDLFVGTHGQDPAKASAMYIQKTENNACSKTFNYYSNSSNYSQVVGNPRITGRYMFANMYGNADGLPGIIGQDADRLHGARYTVTSVDDQNRPVYSTKAIGCYQQGCVPLDTNGDGVLEFIAPNDLVIKDGVVSRARNQLIHDAAGKTLATLVPPDGTRMGHIVTVFDVDNDGVPELVNPIDRGYWSRNAGGDYTWNANKFPESALNQFTQTGHTVPIDYDNDGDYDLYMGEPHYSVTGSEATVPYGPTIMYPYLFRNDGGSFVEVTEAAGLKEETFVSTSFHSAYGNSFAADVNLDGHMDIVYGAEATTHRVDSATKKATSTQVVMMLNNGDGTFTVDRSNDFGITQGRPWVAMADYDNDGWLDLLKIYNEASSAILWRNTTANGNHWLRVRAQGKTTDGFHARIAVRNSDTGQLIATQQVGVYTQSNASLLPHFGLGTATKVDVEVAFPYGGPTHTYRNLAADQDIIVRLDGSIVAPYIPGTNPLHAVATGVPSAEEPPVEEPL